MKQILVVIFFFGILVPIFGNELKSDTSQIPLPTGGVSHPIRFLSFSAVRIHENINIEFSTPSESITSDYYLERSGNGIDWDIVATIPTLSNLNTVNKYNYTDLNIRAKIIYYRVKQVWQNGVYSYSPIVYAKIKSLHEKIMISGQPGNAIAIYFPEEIKGTVNVHIRNLNGQILMNQMLSKPAGYVLLQTDMVNRGMLVVSLSDGEILQMSKTVLLH